MAYHIVYLIRQMATPLTFFKYENKGHQDNQELFLKLSHTEK